MLQILICRDVRHGKSEAIKKFSPAFFKRRRSQGRKPHRRCSGLSSYAVRFLSPSADGEIPNRSKAPPKGECQAKGLAEGGPLVGVLRLGEVMNRTSGGFPFLHKGYLNSTSAFFFGTTGAKKKVWQKRRRRKIISRLARRDQRSARWISGRFLKKAT